jgi:hypothetical protein
VVTGDDQHLRVRAGTTGNRIDPDRRVPRSCWELRRVGGQLEILATWPVAELVTHRAGDQVDQLRDDVRAAGGDPDADLALIATAAAPLLAGSPAGVPLQHQLWAALYPLLAEPVGRAGALGRVPVVLDRILRAGGARRAAALAYGRATRPLVRAFAASLLPADDRRIPFEPAVLALMASPWCGPEQLCSILATPPHRPGAVAFDVADVDRARAAFSGVAPRRVADRLRRALVEPDGTRLLAEELAAWRPEPPPRPVAAPAPIATTQRPPVRTDAVLRHPPRLRALVGVEVAGHRIVLPRTADDLLGWGRALDNCLGSYRHVVAEGRTHVLGLEDPGCRLRYAVEVTRSQVLRQIEGRGNRAAPPSIAAPVLELLRARDVVRADGRCDRSLPAPG